MYVCMTEVRVGGGCRSRETGAARGVRADVGGWVGVAV